MTSMLRPIRTPSTVLIALSGLSACATVTPDIAQAVSAMSAPRPGAGVDKALEPARFMRESAPPPPPRQLKPQPDMRAELADPRRRVSAANAAARVQPVRDDFINAIQRFPWTEGALYQVYTAPGQVTDIALEKGETLTGPGPIAAGDTVRWIIGDTTSGSGDGRRVHILVKPTRPDLVTNLVINTDRRTYHLELRATPSTYMASVSWIYPKDELIALRKPGTAAETATVARGIAVEDLQFGYTIRGDDPPWRPLRAFDDGRQVFIELPPDVDRGELAPLFVLGASGDAELVNYRVAGRYIVVDQLFAVAEMRLGDRKKQTSVRISRTGTERSRRHRR